MGLARYPFTLASYNPDQLDSEVRGLGLTGYACLVTSGTTVECLFESTLSSADYTTLYNKVAAHVPDPAWQTTVNRGVAQGQFQLAEPAYMLVRAVVLSSLSEINLLRDWLTQFREAVAAAASLADLKSRVAALPAMPQRTAAQAKSSVVSNLTSGAAD